MITMRLSRQIRVVVPGLRTVRRPRGLPAPGLVRGAAVPAWLPLPTLAASICPCEGVLDEQCGVSWEGKVSGGALGRRPI